MLAAPSSQQVSLRHLEVGYHLGVMSLLGATCLGEGKEGASGQKHDIFARALTELWRSWNF